RSSVAYYALVHQQCDKLPNSIVSHAKLAEPKQLIAAQESDPLAGLPRAEKFLFPLKLFADHAAVGVVNLTTDKSGTPRGVPMLFRSDDKIELSFPLRVVALATDTEPTIEADSLTLAMRHIPLDVGHVLPLAFYGRHGTIRTISAASILKGEVASEAFRDRIVVIGATVTGGGDLFPTSFDPVMPGVEIVGTAITHLMAGDGMLRNRSTRAADAILAIALTLLLVALLQWRSSHI